MKKRFLLYGANGYTGRLIVDFAKQYGLEPVLAGRNEVEIPQLAEEYGYDHIVLDLNDLEKLHATLGEFELVLHCAGPFKFTFNQMAQACLETKTHYLDITGEIDVFKALQEMDEEAKLKGIMLLPGVGFDVVPTDCMAAYLSQKMPEANSLELAFRAGEGISRGTLNTAIESINSGAMIRENAMLKRVPYAYKIKNIDFGDGPVISTTIPWGDVFTAYYSTGIPNIEVYMASSKTMVRMQKWTRYFSGLLSWSPVKKLLKNRIQKAAPGPDMEQREKNTSRIWGKVTDNDNRSFSALLIAPNGYTLTANTALMAVERILNGEVKPGFQTPSNAFGTQFLLELEACSIQDIPQ
jgi:short subunit dehydrogenase-like uncharacterized protein